VLIVDELTISLGRLFHKPR